MKTYTPNVVRKIIYEKYRCQGTYKLSKLHKKAFSVAQEWIGGGSNGVNRITCFLQGYYYILFKHRKIKYFWTYSIQDFRIAALKNANDERFLYKDLASIEERRWAFMRGVEYCIKINKIKFK